MKQEIDLRNGVWVTPKSFFEPLRAEFDLQIDAAASPDNAMLPVFFCEGVRDAFEQDWSGKRIWCNPPYGRREIYRWVKQCATGGFSRGCAAASANRYALVSRLHLSETRRGNSIRKKPNQILGHDWRGQVPINGGHF